MNSPSLHVVALPHTHTTRAFNHCAFTSKARKFSDMMTAQDYEVILYGAEYNEAACAEHVPCITREQQAQLHGDRLPVEVEWSGLLWDIFNAQIIVELYKRIQPHDIICLTVGIPHAPILAAFPNHLIVETGVGYSGTVAPYRVFESYAWMHAVYGEQQGAMGADGSFSDAVIPNFYDISEFPAGDPEDYFLFMSRMTPRKGYDLAIEAAREAGVHLKIAGIGGDRPESDHVEYVGLVDTDQRADLLSGARGVFMPTLYLEPFGGVAAEAMLCGTPVISTDWGAFPELIAQGVDGFRCRGLREFVEAVPAVDDLDRAGIRARAQARFGMDVVGKQYDNYFNKLSTPLRHSEQRPDGLPTEGVPTYTITGE